MKNIEPTAAVTKRCIPYFSRLQRIYSVKPKSLSRRSQPTLIGLVAKLSISQVACFDEVEINLTSSTSLSFNLLLSNSSKSKHQHFWFTNHRSLPFFNRISLPEYLKTKVAKG
ncbi:hypothetical protein HHI36_014202 [Cryptolaemus montrouzieri]|uniref:Uncharacterized protein n=1 Tax=Cryptolaemus montrouzieri TaxID=559131 RepID=A0ABD2N264_9CUCU